MTFYRLGYRETLDLPIAVFWEMSKNINRIQAENDFRALRVAQASQLTGDGLSGLNDALQREIGDVVVIKETLDRDGLSLLKMMSV